MPHRVDSTRHNVIVARLADFCQWTSRISQYEQNPWDYMLRKVLELKEPVSHLKQDQLKAAADDFILEKEFREEDIVEFKAAIHAYLSPSDFIDISFNLTPESLANPAQRETAFKTVRQMRAASLFEEEEKPESERLAQTKKLVSEMYHRLGLDTLDNILKRKPRTPRRKRMVLRRLRKNVAEYCSVLRLSFDSKDTLSPFMLLRVEALLVTCLRLLEKYR